MKNFLFFGIVWMMINCSSTQKVREINQSLDSNNKREIILVKVSEDSRCPEGAQCVWAGEVIFEVAAFEKGLMVEKKVFTLNPQSKIEIRDWFESHLPKNEKKLKGIELLPYPKKGIEINPKDYKIILDY